MDYEGTAAAVRAVRRGRRAPWWVFLCAACASGGGGGGGGDQVGQLTNAQLAAASSPDETLYTTLIRIRPQWLIAPTGRPGATVFVDEIETGPVSTLQVIASRAVASVQFLTPQAATSRFGRSVEGGAIDVRLLPE